MTRPVSPETPVLSVDEVLDRVIGIVGLFTNPRHIDPRASLKADLALDGLDRMGIACEIAETLHVDVSDEDLEDWDTVEDIARTVEAALRSKVA